jgi:hypothetical protein
MSPQELLQTIMSTVAPDSWAAKGGPCSIQYFPRKKAMVISQDQGTHELIEGLLAQLRRTDEAEKSASDEQAKEQVAAFLKELFGTRPMPMVGEETTGGDSEACEEPPMSRPTTTPPPPQPCPPGDDGEEAGTSAEAKSDLERSLDARINLFCRKTTLREFLDGLSTWKGVKFVPETEALEQAGASLDSEVTLSVNNMPLKKALACALEPLSLKAVVKDDHVVITSKTALRAPIVAAGYDVSDLLIHYEVDWNRHTDELQLGTHEGDPHELVDLIVDGVAPETWEAHGGLGRISYNQELKTLFIHQTPEVQEQVREFLDAKRRELELHKKNGERQIEENRPTDDGSRDNAFRHLPKGDLADYTEGLGLVRPLHPLPLLPSLPPVDFNIPQAFNEILNMAPPRTFFEVHESGSFEESEDRPPSCTPTPRLFVEPEECDLNVDTPETSEGGLFDALFDSMLKSLRMFGSSEAPRPACDFSFFGIY